MKAVGLYKSLPIDHPEALLDVDVPKPTPGERDLLVAVKAIAVNPVDSCSLETEHKHDAAHPGMGCGGDRRCGRPGGHPLQAG